IRALGKGSLPVSSDVTDTRSLAALRDAVVKEFGSTDILINPAGRTKRTPTLEVSDKEWHEILETNGTQFFALGISGHDYRVFSSTVRAFVFLQLTCSGILIIPPGGIGGPAWRDPPPVTNSKLFLFKSVPNPAAKN